MHFISFSHAECFTRQKKSNKTIQCAPKKVWSKQHSAHCIVCASSLWIFGFGSYARTRFRYFGSRNKRHPLFIFTHCASLHKTQKDEWFLVCVLFFFFYCLSLRAKEFTIRVLCCCAAPRSPYKLREIDTNAIKTTTTDDARKTISKLCKSASAAANSTRLQLPTCLALHTIGLATKINFSLISGKTISL